MVAIIILGILGFALILWRNSGGALPGMTIAPNPGGTVTVNKSPVTTALVTAGCTAGGGPAGGAACNALLKTKYGGAAANVGGSASSMLADAKFSGDGSFTSGLKYAVEPWRW